jgi:hypothetical protein
MDEFEQPHDPSEDRPRSGALVVRRRDAGHTMAGAGQTQIQRPMIAERGQFLRGDESFGPGQPGDETPISQPAVDRPFFYGDEGQFRSQDWWPSANGVLAGRVNTASLQARPGTAEAKPLVPDSEKLSTAIDRGAELVQTDKLRWPGREQGITRARFYAVPDVPLETGQPEPRKDKVNKNALLAGMD